jgi:hypothetical protein
MIMIVTKYQKESITGTFKLNPGQLGLSWPRLQSRGRDFKEDPSLAVSPTYKQQSYAIKKGI